MSGFQSNPNPVGTPQEIVDQLESPSQWASCFAQGGRMPDGTAVAGCAFAGICRMPFKNAGPQNILYHIKIADTKASDFKETTCFNWYGSLAARAAGSAEDGAEKDIIRLVGFEGDPYETYVTLAMKPEDKADPRVKEPEKITRMVARFPRPGEPGSLINGAVAADDDLVERMAERFALKAKKVKVPVELQESIEDDRPHLEPLRRGPGRPRKSESDGE